MKAADETMAPEQCQDTKTIRTLDRCIPAVCGSVRTLTGRKVPAAAGQLRKDSLRCMSDYIAVAPGLDQAVVRGWNSR